VANDITITSLTAVPTINSVLLTATASSPVGMTCLSYLVAEKIEFWAGTVNQWAASSKIGESAIGTFIHSGLPSNVTRYYWARAIDHDGNVGALYPVGAGLAATTLSGVPPANSVGSTELKDGAVTTTKLGDATITSAKIIDAAITNAKIASLAADKLTAGTINVTLTINSPTITGGRYQTATSGARVEIVGANNSVTTYDSSNRALLQAGGLTGGTSVNVNAYTNVTALFALHQGTGSDAHAFRGRNTQTGGGQGIVGVSQGGGGYAFFAQDGNYGPFTGAHDALLLKDDGSEVGDIVVDVKVLARDGVDNVLTEVCRCSSVGQRGVLGIVSARGEFDPNAHLSGLHYDNHFTGPTFIKLHFAKKYHRATINAAGEGQVKVCGRGGNFELGDLIIASDMPGKGQRQPDDIVRSHTVARIREAVTFDSPDDVRLVACLYV
jgi:hypothetical protein